MKFLTNTCTDLVILRTNLPYITASNAIGGTTDSPTKASSADM